MADIYVTKQVESEAMQFDGTPANGYAILSWLYSMGRSGTYKDGYSDQGPDRLETDNQYVLPQDWVVLPSNQAGVFVMNQKDFEKNYEPKGDSLKGQWG